MNHHRKTTMVGALILAMIFPFGCTGDYDSLRITDTSESMGSTEIVGTDTSNYTPNLISSGDFVISENEEGVPVMTGSLSSGVLLNARLYCESDVANPGVGSVDTALLRVGDPEVVAALVDENWTIVSDVTVRRQNGPDFFYDSRTIECSDESNEKITVGNTSYSVFLNRSWCDHPARIPWFSTDYNWETDDFSFMKSDEAYRLFEEAAHKADITLSHVYKLDRVPYKVFDVFSRLMISYGESIPEKEWTSSDDAYCFLGSQNWNQLPVISGEGLGHVYDGQSLSGEDYRNTLSAKITAVITAEGIKSLVFYSVFELETQGENAPLISLWDALQSLKDHIENPIYPDEIFFLPSAATSREMTIDQIELCYVPILREKRANEKSGYDLVYDMVPCWAFRAIYQQNNVTCSCVSLVHAITGEYILQTTATEGEA